MESFKNTFMIFVETLDGGAVGALGDVEEGASGYGGAPGDRLGGAGVGTWR